MLLPPANSFYVAAPLAWAGLTAVLLAMPHEPKSAPAPSPVVAQFDERWEEPAPLKKEDRLPLPAVLREPLPVQTEPVVLAQAEAPVEVKPAAPKKSMREGICAKGKRWFKRNGWKYWRCRR